MSTINSQVDLYDSEIIAIEKGPMAYMVDQQFKSMDLEHFRRAVVEKFQDVGFQVDVKCYDTDQSGVYAFDVDIVRRLQQRDFDYDRQVHEVTRNILQLPDQDGGFIKTDEAMMKMLKSEREHGKHKH